MNLYLDNHPDDKNAINTYNSLCNQFAQARYAYENKYGPLTNFGYAQVDALGNGLTNLGLGTENLIIRHQVLED